VIYLDILKKVDPSQIEIYEKYEKAVSNIAPFDIWNFVEESGLISSDDLLWCMPFQGQKNINDVETRGKLALQFAQAFWEKHYQELGCKRYEYVLFYNLIPSSRITLHDGITRKEFLNGLEKRWKEEMAGSLFEIPELIAAEILIPEFHLVAFDNNKDTNEFLASWLHIPLPFVNIRSMALQVKDFAMDEKLGWMKN